MPRGVPGTEPSPGERGYRDPHVADKRRPGRQPLDARTVALIRDLDDLGCNTAEIAVMAGVAYSTAYRYRTGFGEYRLGRTAWGVRDRLREIGEAQAHVRRRGALASEGTALLAAELLSDVEGLPEDVRDVLLYHGR